MILFGGGAVSNPHAAVAAEIDNAEDALDGDADKAEREQAFVGALRTAKRRVMVEVATPDMLAEYTNMIRYDALEAHFGNRAAA